MKCCGVSVKWRAVTGSVLTTSDDQSSWTQLVQAPRGGGGTSPTQPDAMGRRLALASGPVLASLALSLAMIKSTVAASAKDLPDFSRSGH